LSAEDDAHDDSALSDISVISKVDQDEGDKEHSESSEKEIEEEGRHEEPCEAGVKPGQMGTAVDEDAKDEARMRATVFDAMRAAIVRRGDPIEGAIVGAREFTGEHLLK